MRHRLIVIAALAGAALGSASVAVSASARAGSGRLRSQEARVGQAPHTPAGARSIGALPGQTLLSVTVALKPRDPAALAAYAATVSDPGSPHYRDYLTVSQFARRFGPTQAELATVRSALRARGLTPGPLSANHLAMPVRATAAGFGRAFSTSFRRLVLAGGRRAFANTVAPALPAGAARHVEGVIGLDDLARPVPEALRYRAGGVRRAPAAAHTDSAGPQACSTAAAAASSEPGTLTTDQIASAYGFPALYGAGDLGAGQTIAVYELEADIPSDISAYQACFGTDAAVSNVQVDGGPAPLDPQQYDGLETDLDVETAIGLAPRARILIYQGPNASGAGPYDIYNTIVSQDLASVITTSWGICEPSLGQSAAQAEANLFQEAAVQGQTVVAAAGDSGSTDCYDADGSRALAVDDPASQPFVTGVGGTELSVGPPRSETVWGDSSGAGGGGVSSLWPMPAYQASTPASLNVVNPYSSGAPCGASPGYCREVPDVSADADPASGEIIYYGGNGDPGDSGAWGGIGGTSEAAPIWSALVALTNASSACAGSPIGFANPALYRAAASGNTANFYDVTAGDNSLSLNGVYPATAGYDMASGLGAPGSGALATALCGDTLSLRDPGPQTSALGAAVHLQLQAHDVPNRAITYTAHLPPGLTINGFTGLISGSPTALGTYSVSVRATDSDGSIANLTFDWTVVPVSVTLANPGSRTSGVGTRVRLQIGASDNNGGALSYSATGLPPGLSIGRSSGLITGRPSRPGVWSVSVTARDGQASSGEQFVWTIEGRPRISHASLRGLSRRRPRLAFSLAPGAHGSPIESVRISLPAGLSFAGGARALRHGLTVKGVHGAPVAFTVRRVRGALVIDPATPGGQLSVAIAPPALVVSPSLAAQVARGDVRWLRVTIAVTDQSGWSPRLSLRLGV